MLRASAAAEAAGFPSSSLVCSGFLGQGATTSVGLGMPNLPMAEVPGHPDAQTDQELHDNVPSVTVRDVIENLTQAPPAGTAIQEPGSDDVVLEGSFEEVNRFYYEKGWSDGLPIVPPTRDKVEAFLGFTDLLAGHVIGRLLPDNREATAATSRSTASWPAAGRSTCRCWWRSRKPWPIPAMAWSIPATRPARKP